MSLEHQFSEVKRLITAARNKTYQAVNRESVLLNWHVGAYVSKKLQSASWGEGVVEQLSEYLKAHEAYLERF